MTMAVDYDDDDGSILNFNGISRINQIKSV